MALRRKTKTGLERVEELRQNAAADRRPERELDGEKQAAEAAREEARERLVAALAEGSDGEEEQRALEQAEERAGVRWDEIKEAARRRTLAADRAISLHIAANFDEVRAEKLERDRRVHQRVVAAAEELQHAIKAANVEAGAWTPLLVARNGGAPAGPQIPPLALDSLGQELKRTLSRGIQRPTPPEFLGDDSAREVAA